MLFRLTASERRALLIVTVLITLGVLGMAVL